MLSEPDAELKNQKAADFDANGELDIYDLGLMKRALLSQKEMLWRNNIMEELLHWHNDIHANHILWYEGLDSVLTLKRSVNSDQAHRKVDGRIEARLIEIACSPAPEGHSRWTIRLLEDEMKMILDEPISREAIRRTLKKST